MIKSPSAPVSFLLLAPPFRHFLDSTYNQENGSSPIMLLLSIYTRTSGLLYLITIVLLMQHKSHGYETKTSPGHEEIDFAQLRSKSNTYPSHPTTSPGVKVPSVPRLLTPPTERSPSAARQLQPALEQQPESMPTFANKFVTAAPPTSVRTNLISSPLTNINPDGSRTVRNEEWGNKKWSDDNYGSTKAPTQATHGGVQHWESETSNTQLAPTEDSPQVLETSSTVTYAPGDLRKKENGLLLSVGLKSRVIAQKGEPVPLKDGSFSTLSFHSLPDGAATFLHPDGKSWAYVSNSEVDSSGGGVGSVLFDEDGAVVNYTMILTDTSRNCSGGKTPWGTWVSCEEHVGGLIYEVDPFGNKVFSDNSSAWQLTELASDETAGRFETAACDNRHPKSPVFYVTKDDPSGEIRRFKPSAIVLAEAKATGDYTRVLSSPGSIDYLVLNETSANGGTYTWSPEIKSGKRSARQFFQKCEGIAFDAGRGQLYFVSKKQQEVFILEIEGDPTYAKFSTEVAGFPGQPDQIEFLSLGGDEHMLYFTEEGGKAGVHGRDTLGNFYPIVKINDFRGDTSGLAFSPDRMHLYFCVQNVGIMYDITREDGKPFDGKAMALQQAVPETSVYQDVMIRNSRRSNRLR